MSYDLQTMLQNVFLADTAAKNYINLVTTVGVQGELRVQRRCEIRRIALSVAITSATSTANPVVTFQRRPTPGSATGAVTLGTITIPTGSAAPKVYFKDITPVILNAGESIAFNLTTQGTDASAAAGTAYAGAELLPTPEVPLNESNMVASA